MNLKQFIKDYFSFTRQERIGVIVILLLLLLVFFLPEIIPGKNKTQASDSDTAWVNAIHQLQQNNSDSTTEQEINTSFSFDQTENALSKKETGEKTELFYFDPNSISADEWKRLGIKDKTIQTIQNYISKGGSFRKPEDLQKIYGLSKPDYERLLPYIKIETAKNTPLQQLSVAEGNKPETRSYKKQDYAIIELNNADTTALISLPGIGSKLAQRIINFRDKLGGFYSVEQVKETYGLPDSIFQKIYPYLEVNNSLLKKININTISLIELKQHPYFRFSIANPVIQYRNEHGRFSTSEDIRKVMVITDDVYCKIAPYITIQ